MRPMHLMHIDDDDNHAYLVKTAVDENRLPCRVIRYSDAESGIEHLIGQSDTTDDDRYILPDMILLDLGLPGMGGFEFLKQIRANDRTRGIPVVVLSASNNRDEIRRAYCAGANSYIVKPTDLTEFMIKLAEMNNYWAMTAELP